MAAFRGRSLDLRGFGSVVVGVGVGLSMGLEFCAPVSGRLMLAASCRPEPIVHFCFFGAGLLESLTSGFCPVIEVSGTPAFRGGGGRSGRV